VGKVDRPDNRKWNRAKAIHEFCLECLGGSAFEVSGCTLENCALYWFRRGTDDRPGRVKRVLSDDAKNRLFRAGRDFRARG